VDELRPTAIDNAGKRSSTAGSTGADHKAAAKQGEAEAHETAPISEDVLGQPRNAAGEVLNQAKDAAEEVIEQAKNAASDALTSLAHDIAEQAPEIAQRVRDQAGAAAETLYRQGGEFLSPKVQAYPLTALLIAGVAGYSLGYLFSRPERAQTRASPAG
jgi:ElaB/YqjD/DUF883 family membrane-anchored ribosome-binding protein